MCRKYESLIHGFNDDAPVRQAPEEEPYIEDKTKIHGFNDDAPTGSGGGDPFDFDDRMDAFADPFGFGGDGDPVD